jgi:membrane associated rhomboid family serine protease
MYFGTLLTLGQPQEEVMINLIYNPDSNNFMHWGMDILAMFYPSSVYFAPYQIITHMFMHGSISHLFFNMFAVFMFGPPLENLWGPKRFLFFYLVTGFGALFLHLFVKYIELHYMGADPISVNVPVLGASGAVFGVLVGFGMNFPNTRLMLLFPPIPIKAKYFVAGYAVIELFLGLGNFSSGVAHFAHVGGALFGLLLILYWRKYGSRL